MPAIQQMLGRAGRPQFDDRGVAVVMTEEARAGPIREELLGDHVVESKLHKGLAEHLNAEVGGPRCRCARARRSLKATASPDLLRHPAHCSASCGVAQVHVLVRSLAAAARGVRSRRCERRGKVGREGGVRDCPLSAGRSRGPRQLLRRSEPTATNVCGARNEQLRESRCAGARQWLPDVHSSTCA